MTLFYNFFEIKNWLRFDAQDFFCYFAKRIGSETMYIT